MSATSQNEHEANSANTKGVVAEDVPFGDQRWVNLVGRDPDRRDLHSRTSLVYCRVLP